MSHINNIFVMTYFLLFYYLLKFLILINNLIYKLSNILFQTTKKSISIINNEKYF